MSAWNLLRLLSDNESPLCILRHRKLLRSIHVLTVASASLRTFLACWTVGMSIILPWKSMAPYSLGEKNI